MCTYAYKLNPFYQVLAPCARWFSLGSWSFVHRAQFRPTGGSVAGRLYWFGVLAQRPHGAQVCVMIVCSRNRARVCTENGNGGIDFRIDVWVKFSVQFLRSVHLFAQGVKKYRSYFFIAFILNSRYTLQSESNYGQPFPSPTLADCIVNQMTPMPAVAPPTIRPQLGLLILIMIRHQRACTRNYCVMCAAGSLWPPCV